jgi:zinc finger MIZ domain-containing protein
LCFNSKSAQLEGLEVDQYIWAILSKLGPNSEAEEITIDAQANWKTAKHEIKAENDSDDACGARSRHNKMMSPGSLTLPTTNNWDMTQVMSPYLPPDMSSELSCRVKRE